MAGQHLDLFMRRLRHSLGEGVGLTDADLLQRFLASRDEAAFEVLVWRHGPLVLGVCSKVLHQAEDAEDVFQATFLTLARKAHSIARPEALPAWLVRTACRLAWRVRSHRDKRLETGQSVTDIHTPFEVPQAENDVAPILYQELNRLPEKYRLPVILCYLQGLTTEEAALHLGCPRGTICTRLATARQRLRQRLMRRGVAPAAASGVVWPASHACASLPPVLASSTIGTAMLVASGQPLPFGLVPGGVARLLRPAPGLAVTARFALVLVLVLFGIGVVVWGKCSSTESLAEATPLEPNRESGSGKPAKDEPKKKPEPLSFKVPGLSGMVLSPDGKWLAAAAGKDVKLFVAETGKPSPSFPGLNKLVGWKNVPDSWVHALAFSPDSKFLAVAAENPFLRILNVNDGAVKNSMENKHPTSIALAFRAGGRQLVSVGGWRPWLVIKPKEELTIHDLATGKALTTFPVPSYQASKAVFSPGGDYLAGIDLDKNLKVFDVATGKEVFSSKDQLGVNFSPDGKRLTTFGKDGMIRLWDLSQGKELTKFKGPVQEMVIGFSSVMLAVHPKGKHVALGLTKVTETPAGQVLSTSDVTLWDIDTAKQVELVPIPPPPPWAGVNIIYSLAFTPDGQRLVAACSDEMVRVWPVNSP
jgi:RNA polymerase sigma factor (sigma-70 family)